MDKNSAIQLLDKTFNQEFNSQQFSTFIKELFNDFQIKPQTWTVWKEYQEYIDSYIQLGSYEDQTKRVIDILSVKLKKTSSRDRARTMQRNFIAKYLGNAEKDAALVAFYGDDPQDWRFSFVKMDYHLQETEPGKVKPVKELTPAKRYSFLVGRNEPNYTCKKQFLPLVVEERVNPSIEEIERAFSIENVTKEFFIEYRELYYKLKESLEKIMQKNSKLRTDFEEKGISTVDFAKKLLGQIVFIYFLQKKGWLGVGKDEKGQFNDWGSGPKNFLRKLFNKEIVPYNNFFNDILEPLFYDALAIERTANQDYYPRFNCKIPFLNGGLFEPINDYDWVGTEIFLGNKIFADIFDTFDRYNFTVKEDEPLEKEVAIDPEMLGKVFENLLEVKDRKSKGSYYTPREIVHYMCQQSLINYLETNSGIPRTDIEKFVQLGDFTLDQIIKEQEQLKKYGKTYDIIESRTLPKSIKENALKLDKLLQEVKIVDPAVGSGAFPVGMMNEIVKARSILQIFLKTEKISYDLKRETIENCLYGVDIDSSAVDIAKLRFWLSLIVDELDMKNIKPLPNLDHKIMCGNSLLEEFEGIKLFDERLLGEAKKSTSVEAEQIKSKMKALYLELGQINLGKIADNGRSKEIKKELSSFEKKLKELREGPEEEPRQQTLNDSLNKRIKESQRKLSELRKLQKEFFNEQNRQRKKQQAGQINKLEWELIEETLKEQGNDEAIKKLAQYKKNKSKPFFLWKLYFAEVFQRQNPGFDIAIGNPPYDVINDPTYRENYKDSICGRANLYGLFIHKCIRDILRDKGLLVFINPKTMLADKYFTNLRKYFKNNGNFKAILKVTERHNVFENVLQAVIVYLFQKTSIQNPRSRVQITEIRTKEDIEKSNQVFSIDYDALWLDNRFEDAFLLSDKKEVYSIFDKIKRTTSFKETGIVFTTGKIQWDLFKKKLTNKPTKNSIRLIWGENIQRYRFSDSEKRKGKEFILGPLEIKPNITSTTIVTQRTTADEQEWRIIATIFDPRQQGFVAFSENNTNFLERADPRFSVEFILGILSSKFFDIIFRHINSNTHVSSGELNSLPIKEFTTKQQTLLEERVNNILRITKDPNYQQNFQKQHEVKKLEAEIDKLVYKLYELTPEEIKIVEESVADE